MSVSKIFYSIGESLVGLFIPAFMLIIGYSPRNILFFMVCYSAIMVINNFSTYFVNRKFGTRYSMAAGFIFQSLLYITLASDINNAARLAIMAFCSGMVDGFLWSTKHFLTSISTDDARHSRQLSKLSSISSYASILGLATTGFVSRYYNLNVLPYLAACCSLIAGIIILRVRNIKIEEKFSIKNARASVSIYEGIANLGLNWFGLGYIGMFSLYVYIHINNLPSIAALVLVSAIIDIIANKLIGLRGDSGDNKKILTIGSILVSISSPFLYFAQTIPYIIAISVFKSRLSTLIATPWQALYYAKVKKEKMPYITTLTLELWGDSGRFILVSLIYILSLVMSLDYVFFVSFVIGGISTLLLNLMPDYMYGKKY